VGSSLKGLAGTVKGFTFTEFSDGLKNVTSGFASLGKALLFNPLFLIITGSTLLIANFEKITALFDGITDAQVEAAAAQQKSADAAKAQYDQISATENTLRLQGKTEKEILELKKQALDTAILEQQTAIESQQVILNGQIEAAERNKSVLKGILDFITIPIQIILEGIDSIGSAFGQDFGLESAFGKGLESIASAVFDPEEIKVEGQKTIDAAKKQLAELQNTRDGFEVQEKEKAKAAAAERAEARKKEADAFIESQRQVSEELAKLLAEQEAEEAESLRRRLDAQVKANEERIKKEDEQFALLQSLIQSESEKEIEAVVAKYEALFEVANGNAELETQLATKQAEELKAISDKAAADEIANQERVNASKVQLASDTIGALISITDSFGAKNEAQAKRQFNINKGLQIAQALIQTYQSANAAFASAAANPLTIAFPGFPFVQAGLAVAAGLAQVNKIRQTTFNSSGGGSASAGSSASVSGSSGGGSGGGTPQFNPVNTDFVNSRPPQPPRAYVMANDVIKGVEATEQIDRQARL
jgi:chemotaxis protein histidine kinase CheA